MAQFAVSAGRCTKGIYCQMIPVDKKSIRVDYDYLMIVDTEGLRAHELQDVSQSHDNELATFIIGLGDATIVNVKGENISDINDILQIVVHAMVRIKIVKPNLLNPSCVFIHQNVPSPDAEDQLKVGHEILLSKLDHITRKAAEQENASHIHNFQDIIAYDEDNYAFYMPDLWHGQPPMAPVNCGYSRKVKVIKNIITTTKLAEKSTPITISRFITKLSDLWNAILKDNLVFSFKNSDEVNAFLDLDQEFTKLYWEFMDESFHLQIQCQSGIASENTKDVLLEKHYHFAKKIYSDLTRKYREMKDRLENYFKSHKNRDILDQWREQHMIKLAKLCSDEIRKRTSLCESSIHDKIKQLEISSELNIHNFEQIVLLEATQLRERNIDLNDSQLYEHFRTFFKEWSQSIESTTSHKEPKITDQRIADMFILFKNTYRNGTDEEKVASWFITEVSNWVQASIQLNSGRSIALTVIANEASWFDKKFDFINSLLVDIGETGNFQDFMNLFETGDLFSTP